MKEKRAPVIAIDGTSGVGKTTISKLVAKKLGFIYIDTGAMYRAFAIAAKEKGVQVENEEELKEFCDKIDITFKNNNGKIYVNEKDYTEAIRTHAASELSSIASAKKCVREKLVSLQRKLGKEGRVVMEGRDIGTVVFPDADVKIFLDADKGVRAERRFKEIKGLNIKTVEEKMQERDMRDSQRTHSPLKMAKDAILIDTTNLNLEEVEEKVLEIIKGRTGIGNFHS